jgi:hypothetical protein
MLGIESLALRRIHLDLTLAYKILFGLVDVSAENYFTFAYSGHNTRGHSYKLLLQHSRVDVRKRFSRSVLCLYGIALLPQRQTSVVFELFAV